MFRLKNTEFEIAEVRFEVCETNTGHSFNFSVQASQEHFNRLAQDEGSEWSWALYAPQFYANGCPFSPDEPSSRLTLTGEELDEAMDDPDSKLEVGVYLMEHGWVSGVTIEVAGRTLAASGTVELFGEEYEFEIKCDRPQT